MSHIDDNIVSVQDDELLCSQMIQSMKITPPESETDLYIKHIRETIFSERVRESASKRNEYKEEWTAIETRDQQDDYESIKNELSEMKTTQKTILDILNRMEKTNHCHECGRGGS